MKISRAFRCSAPFVLLLIVRAAATQEDTNPSDWGKFESLNLEARRVGIPTTLDSRMLYSRATGDIRIEREVSDPKDPQRGTILMVAGRVFASKGLKSKPGSEIDALDQPLLYSLLLAQVLTRSMSIGPAALTTPQKIAFEDTTRDIRFATPSASGRVPAPWSVSGTIAPQSNRSYAFDLSVKWSETDAAHGAHPVEVQLKGELAHQNNFRIDDNLSLDDWSVFNLGKRTVHLQDRTIVDYGTKPMAQRPRTVADIRRQLADEDFGGTPDLTLKLAGFWKRNCSDSFGLRISPVDTPGMYAVTFCGPGGCVDEQRRKTFINGDKHFRVVSPIELQVVRDEGTETYHKCTDGV